MKIVYGITKSNFGGAQRYVFDLARASRKAGHDVSAIVGGEGPLIEKLKNHGIKVFPLAHMQRDISLIDELRSLHYIFRTLFEEKPDVFHVNSSKIGGLGAVAGRLAGVRNIIFTAHGWAFDEPRALWQKPVIKFFVWLTILFSHKTICVSENTCEKVAHWPLVKNRLIVVKNGIDKFDVLPRAQARRELGVHDETFLVGSLAELHPIKGLDILIESWDKFSKGRKAELIILGEGEQRDELEALIEILGLTSSVTLRGYVENARQYLSAFDLFILPSRSENLPYSILEAGLAGIPVVASSVGGIPEIIDSGISGVLVEKENPDDLFSIMLLLSENPDLRKRLSLALEERVSKDFSSQKMSEQTLKVYL